MRHLFIVLFIAIVASVSAQTLLDKPEMYIGVTGGVTGSKVMFNPTVNQYYLLGYSGGIAFRYIAEKNIGVQAEINFSQRGWREKSGAYTRQLSYIELPFMTHIFMGKKTQFVINLGPKISYLISEKELLNTVNDNETQHTTAIQNPFDYGLCGGIGLQFKALKSVVQLDSRVYFGLSDVFSNNKRDYFDVSNNFNISVNLAYYLKVN